MYVGLYYWQHYYYSIMARAVFAIITAKEALCKFLDSVETLWALACVNTDLRNNLKQAWLVKIILEQNLDKLLIKFGSSLPSIKLFISSYPGCIISGSIIAQAFLGVEWEDSDLDIYMFSDKDGYRFAKPDKRLQLFKRPDLKDDNVQHYRCLQNSSYLPKYVKYIVEARTRIEQKTIQFIFVQKKSTHSPTTNSSCSYVVPKFDLSMIQNYYDGSNFHFGYVKNLIKKEMRATHCRWVGKRALPRIQKYQLRGFSFKMTGRKRKYVSKGNLQYMRMKEHHAKNQL